MPRWFPTVASALLAVLALAGPAAADTFTVTNGGDSADAGSGTFHRAILDAAAHPGADTISFAGALLVQDGALPAIAGPLSVDGAGSLVRGSSVHVDGTGVYVSRLGVEAPGRLESGAAPAPAGLGLRRLSDGRLRFVGSTAGAGAVELFGAGGANFLAHFDGLPGGFFSQPIAPEPPPGQALTATYTNASGTSAFAPNVVPGDLTSPVLVSGRTVDTDDDGLVDAVRLDASEGLADASGFGGVALAGVPVAAVGTGARGNDAEFEAALAQPLRGNAQPLVRIAANTSLADPAGNEVLVQPDAVRIADRVAPEPLSAVATSRSVIRISLTEPISGVAPAASAFTLTMGGKARTISGVKLTPDAGAIELEASPAWDYAEAGELKVKGQLADVLGNRSDADRPALRVWAAPGDAAPPTLRGVKITHRFICVKGVSHACRRSGATVSFQLDEAATIVLQLRRLRSSATSALKIARNPGRGAVSFGERVEGRALHPGQYILTVFALDAAGNESKATVFRLKVRR